MAASRLTFRGLVALAFVLTCAGPFGLEAAVRAGGPYRTLIGLAVLPVVVIVPQIAITAELSCMMPHPAGYLYWVQRAHGATAGALNAVNCAVSILTDIAVYPVLALEYLVADGVPLTAGQTWVAKAAVVAFGLAVNAAGLQAAGDCLLASSLLFFAPLAVGAIYALPQVRAALLAAGAPQELSAARAAAGAPTVLAGPGSPTLPPPGSGGVDWGLFLSVLLWLYSGWEGLGCVAAEVTDVRRVFAPAMLCALFLDFVAYAAPLIGAVPAAVATDDIPKWEDGALARYYDALWPGLGLAVAAAAFLSNAALYAAKLLTNARALLGVADAWHGRPMQRMEEPPAEALRAPLLLQGVTSLALIAADFAVLVKITMLLSCITQLLELSGFLRLRYSQPSEPRPVRVPGGEAGAWVSTFLTCGACVVAGGAVFVQFEPALAVLVINTLAGAGLLRRRFCPGAPATPAHQGPGHRGPSPDSIV
eukprot:TRINITY_DN55334_c0_g1_i1.p1 TRINITY_DN55334_c0_g1~~TRINITY_DN55334_c0_g1_i1.p1  ORF type:complete len:512 (+),score=153.29 TRINITY_DN55334_c0_g1_i1:104-1537(+)